MAKKLFAVCVDSLAARLGIEPSPFASEAGLLESPRAATHLRATKADFRLSQAFYLPVKRIL